MKEMPHYLNIFINSPQWPTRNLLVKEGWFINKTPNSLLEVKFLVKEVFSKEFAISTRKYKTWGYFKSSPTAESTVSIMH